MQQQVQPEKIKLLTPQEVAALGPAKVAALADVCVEFGPVSDAERSESPGGAGAAGAGPPADAAARRSRQRVLREHCAVPQSQFAAERASPNCGSQGVKDMIVADAGRGQFAVSFGAFRTEQAAQALAGRNREAGRQAGSRAAAPAAAVADASRRSRSAAAGRRPAQGPADAIRRHRNQGRQLRRGELTHAHAARRSARRRRRSISRRRARCSRNTRRGSTSISASRDSPQELASLPGAYAPPRGMLLLAGPPGRGGRMHRVAAACRSGIGPGRDRRGQAPLCASGGARDGTGKCAWRRR